MGTPGKRPIPQNNFVGPAWGHAADKSRVRTRANP